MKRLTALVASATLALLMFGCGGDATDNKGNTTSNTATTNNATRNVAPVSNSNSDPNINRGTYNANISQEDYDKEKESFGKKAKDLGDKVGSGLTDGWYWVKARGALLAADDLEESGINVDVNNGMITLRGTVPNQDQVKKADAAVKGLSGVKGVQNQLKVAPGSGGPNINSTGK